ncbi:DUF4124 domain-containing protein [Stutzerimonas stutzeri]|uniref:DUF4124 domain-containing protein n=1 Tax=Stutzerimonas stutzeri TaxID=316 RepID=UPI00210EE8F1|nr:DUF4124 domain-containing protein [Stutzerimonas stutzeri]MCQ4259071.1 DUF4124 domain-containing protein [Stutzerimonas stutzeri]
MSKLIAGGFCALLLCATPTLAASIYRCSDADGNLTFTRQGCPINHASQIQEAANPTPGSGKAVPLAKPLKQRKDHADRSPRSLTVVGGQDDGCGNLITGSERRDALIKQQILPGMTRADIESAFGSPDTVTSRNGKVQYRYSGKGRTRTVSFDQYGCVGGKR